MISACVSITLMSGLKEEIHMKTVIKSGLIAIILSLVFLSNSVTARRSAVGIVTTPAPLVKRNVLENNDPRYRGNIRYRNRPGYNKRYINKKYYPRKVRPRGRVYR